MRWLKHLFTTRWHLRNAFAADTLDAIEAAVAASELRHRGELRFAVEAAFDLPQLVRGLTPRQRALELFASLGVWDTEENNGVLVYVLVAEHAVEIVADRGYTGRVDAALWQDTCAHMAGSFASGDFKLGALHGIERLTGVIASAFPGRGPREDEDELPNRPQVL